MMAMTLARTGTAPIEAQYLVIAMDCARPLSPAVRLILDAPRVAIGRSTAEVVCDVEGSGRWRLEDHGTKDRALAIALATDDEISALHLPDQVRSTMARCQEAQPPTASR